ncbi:MAG: hypothetical protein U0995_08930 [Erythrobacter sp.]|nr:hypothetical protein [Erythrobacter sp.]MDZ4272959.1 hypothetical protein [Erythrobacter sp.]MDZ4276149.1 hypothetical protein [Erythrobacter sp.]
MSGPRSPAANAEAVAKSARIAELEQALRDAREDFDLAARVGIADAVIVVELRAMCDRHGYGNVMQSASVLWRQKLGDMAGGEFVAGPCRSTVIRRINKIDAVLRAGKR